MTEYEELREKIARYLQSVNSEKGIYSWGQLTPSQQQVFLDQADYILSIISERCWLKDEKELPDDFYYEFTDIGSGWTGRIEGKISVHLKKFLEEFGYKSVKELKKEAK